MLILCILDALVNCIKALNLQAMTMSGIIPVCVLSHFSHAQLFVTLWTVAHRLLCPRDSSGKNTGVGCHALLQGIFLSQGSNVGLLHLPALAGRFFTTGATWEALYNLSPCIICGGGSKQRGEGGYNGSSSSPSFLFAHFCSPLTFKEHNKEYDH